MASASATRGSEPQETAGICQSVQSRSYEPVEAVIKALEVLKLVNILRVASISDLHKMTGFAKPTIVRMLETMMAAGYVTRDKTFGGYRVTANVQQLADGYFGAPMVIEAAHPFALELTHRIKWAVGVGMLEANNHMRLQFTTASHSPWAMPLTSLRMRLDLCTSSMGRSYLAFCPEHEREALIASYVARYEQHEQSARERTIRQILKQVRERGYALKARSTAGPNTQTISMPIRYDDNVLACLGIGYFCNSVPVSELEERLYLPMRETVEKIEASIADIYATPQHMTIPPPAHRID